MADLSYNAFQTGSTPPPQSTFQKYVSSPIKEAASAGLSELGGGIKQIYNANSLGDMAGGVSHLLSGGISTLSSPFAPIMKPTVGAGVNKLSDVISEDPNIQNFANSKAGKISADIAGGINTGANIVGGVAGAMELGGRISNIWDRAYSTPDTATARIADATPSYSDEMQRQNVKTPEGDIVPRANEGEGITGKRTVNTSASEAKSGSELNNLKDYPDKGTAMEKAQAVGRGINTEAENMRSSLRAEDKMTPLDANAEKVKISQLVRNQLPEDIQSKVGVNTPEENAMLKGMSEKAGSPIPKNGTYDLRAPGELPNLPKTAEGKYYGKVLEALNNYDGTREGKLNLRQAIDQAYENARGKLAWGGDAQNTLDTVNTDIRNSLNKDLGETSKNTDTQASLQKQTNLYRAKDVLETKAMAEAPSQIGRFFQQHPVLHRLATREFMRTATSLISAGAGITILTKLITDTLKGK